MNGGTEPDVTQDGGPDVSLILAPDEWALLLQVATLLGLKPDPPDHADLLGKRVRVKLDEQVVQEGVLLGFGEGGDFQLEGDDGFVWHGWPALDIALLFEDDAP